MPNLGPPAIPGWRQDVPTRLVIVPDATRLVDGNTWSQDAVHNIMKWTDISAATGNWRGIAIATPTVNYSGLFRPSFLEAWREWAESTRIRIVLADGIDSDNITIFGPRGQASTVTFFCKEFFKQYPSLSAWSELLGHMMPQCELNLDGRFQLEGWLSNGQVALPTNVGPKEIVVVRQQTQITYPIPIASASSLPEAC
jgi:hypothetical protein